MPYLFKLSRRVARFRTHSLLLAAAAILGACESSDPALSGPGLTRPSFATATGLPAGVTDLAVAAVTDSSATLTFTEVDDGTGTPASYDIRLAPTPLVWGGSVPSVKRGTCATPVAGTAIGARRACTVLGLTTGTAYDFELVAYRGTLMVDAVFGALSNVATGSTATAAPVASVSVAPGAASLPVGGTQQLVATLKDASGNVLTGPSITWTSSNSGVATFGGNGLVTAIAPGSATLTAASGGKSGTATIPVASQPPVVTSPGTATDLKVTSTADTAATLAFTEVSDGGGKAAGYDVRYVASATMPWGGTPSVSRGTCAAPVVGTSVGATRTCTVLGLSAGTAHNLQLVPDPATLNRKRAVPYP